LPPSAVERLYRGELAARKRRRALAWARSRIPLGCVLVAQAAIAIQLSNTAFLDEASYLYAGHQLIGDALQRTENQDPYAQYFSGAPFLYPVVGAAADAVGGLAAARLLSLVFMLGATCFLYAATRRMFHSRAAFFAAALFALSGPVLFMSHLATFDAPAVLMLSCALWLAVRSAERPALILDTAVAAVAAVVLKYASMVFVVPIIAVGALLVMARRGWRAGLTRGVALSVVTILFAVSAALLAGHDVLTGVVATTTARPADQVPTAEIVARSAVYAGAVFGLAALGAVSYLFSAGSTTIRQWWVRGMLGAVLAGSALIAPLGSIRLHTLTSLQKHAGYGLLLAAPIAGLLLARIGGRSAVRTALATLIAAAVGASGAVQARDFFDEWPNSTALVQALGQMVTSEDQRILAEENSVPRYYLRSRIKQWQWSDTYYLDFTTGTGQRLTGPPAYKAAIAEHHFTIVVLNFHITPALDAELVPVLASSGYREVAKIPNRTRFGTGEYTIWRLSAAPR
jgi:4-amino-4-deoxy-L-arabinose transferase-like glycosyltransferase